MKKLLLIFIVTTTFFSAHSQLAKNDWLIGGSGNFYTFTPSYINSPGYLNPRYTKINISPNIGYFVADKVAFGLGATFSSYKQKGADPYYILSNFKRYLIGPFGRYYFLDSEMPYNLLAEVCYQYGIPDAGGINGKLSSFSALTGPVIYFNNTVGLEFLIGYKSSMEEVSNLYKEVQKGFQFSIGFQIHLSK